jgi:uncharacterized protein (DUF362 family)
LYNYVHDIIFVLGRPGGMSGCSGITHAGQAETQSEGRRSHGMERVGVVTYQNRPDHLARLVEQIDGFKDLRPDDRVLLKPNLVMWDSIYPFPKYGVLTTSLVMEEMVRLLKEYGCAKISIGEGSIVDQGLGSNTKAAFAGLGYHRLREKYGVQLVDFNEGPFEQVEFDGYALDISSHARQTDFLINLPVLKTHSSTKVSLGLKNLKGCLHQQSKMFCHQKERALDSFISRLAMTLRPSLTLIDGIYALEKGPVINGRAYRADLLIASRDPYAADVAGVRLLGFNPDSIEHLRHYGELRGLSPADVEFVGENIDDNALPLEWDWSWLPDNSGPDAFARMGLQGIYFPKYDHTLCSTCSYLNNYLLLTLMGAYARHPFSDMEFLGGKDCLSQGGYSKTFLFGKCAARLNRDNDAITEAVAIRGCPPTKEEILEKLNLHGIKADDSTYAAYRESQFRRYRNSQVFREQDFQVV